MRSPKLTIRFLSTATAALAVATLPQGAMAQTRPTDPSTLDILDVLVEKGILSRDDANSVLSEARKRSETNTEVVRVPYVPEAVRAQIRDEVKKEVVETAKKEGWAQPGSLPGWLDRFSFAGDLRVRAEYVGFGDSNVALTVPDINAINANGEYYVDDAGPLQVITKDRFRTRVRGRFAVNTRVNDYVTGGIRIATGQISDPLSTNETLSGNFDKFMIGLDRAFIRVSPFGRDDRFAGTNVVLGKFENPFYSTELIFDRDIQFDGIAATFAARFGEGPLSPDIFLTAGAFPLEEWDFTSNDKYMFAGQIGGTLPATSRLRFRAAAAYYDFSRVQGQFNDYGMRNNDYTAPDRVQFGNTLFNLRRDNSVVNTMKFGLASKFEVASIHAAAEYNVTPSVIASIEFEGLKNLAFDRQDLLDRSIEVDPVTSAIIPLQSSGDTAWHVRATIGSAKFDLGGTPVIEEANAWSLSAGYRRLEGDSTLDLFADSDFGLGGTDQKGFVIQGNWAPMPHLWLTASWFSSRTINLFDNSIGATAFPVDIDTFLFDLNVNF